MPLAFSTTAVEEVRLELLRTTCPLIDFFDLHMASRRVDLGSQRGPDSGPVARHGRCPAVQRSDGRQSSMRSNMTTDRACGRYTRRM